MAQRRRTREQWQALVAGWARSGLTQAQYCARHGISVSSFHRWREGVRDSADGTRAVEPGDAVGSIRLLPVELHGEPAAAVGGSPLTLVLSNGLRLEVNAGFDAATLRQVLTVVQAQEAP